MSDAERSLLRKSVRDFLAKRWPADTAVERSGSGEAITSLWRDMAGQGLAALGSSADGAGLREIVLVFEELGRASCPAPLLGAVGSQPRARDPAIEHCARAARRSPPGQGHDRAGAWRLRWRSGGRPRRRCAATRCREKRRLSKARRRRRTFSIFTDRPAGVAVVAGDAPGLTVQATPGLAVPPFCRARLREHAGACAGRCRPKRWPTSRWWRGSPAPAGRSARPQRAFELAVDHAKVRKQFGQFIGQFQAVQHKLANCLISLDGARLTLETAAEARDSGNPDWRVFAASALAFAGPALREVSIQTHRALGAIGYAEEHEAPRHFRRVHADLARFGGVPRARAELADFLLGPVSSIMTALPAHDMGPAANAFRKEVRDWLAKHWTPEQRAAHLRKPFKERGWDREFSKLMGRDGWIGVGWPKEFGGQGRSATEQIAFITEMANAGAPAHAHSTSESIVAQALFLHGTKAQQDEWLPADPPRRTLLRAGLQRAGGRLRPCGAAHPRRPRRRRLGRQRPEAVVDRRRQGRLHVARGAHRSGGEEARRHQRADGRSALARHHHPAEHGALRQDLQRAVLRQRAGAGEEHGRRRQQRLEGHHRRARRRAGDDRRHAHGGHRARVRPSHRISEDRAWSAARR